MEVQKNIVPKLTHNIRLLQSLLTSKREFRAIIHEDKSNMTSLLHALDHNIHILDANQDLVINRLDTLAVQNAAIMSHFSITTDQHSVSLPTPTTPPKLQMNLFPLLPHLNPMVGRTHRTPSPTQRVNLASALLP
jgi:hypothetical protein